MPLLVRPATAHGPPTEQAWSTVSATPSQPSSSLIGLNPGKKIQKMTVAFVILVLGGISLFYLIGHQKAYKPDDQSLLVTDILQEARLRSLTERRTMRVEINLSNNTARLSSINEKPASENFSSLFHKLLRMPLRRKSGWSVGSHILNGSYTDPNKEYEERLTTSKTILRS